MLADREDVEYRYKHKLPRRPGYISPRHKALVDNYFRLGFNKARALEATGYKGWEGNAGHYFRHPDIVAEIDRRQKKIMEKYEIDADWIIQRLALMANGFLLLAKFKVVDENGVPRFDFTGASQEELAVINKLHVDEDGVADAQAVDSLGALNSLAKILGIEKSKLEITGKDGGPVEIVDNKEFARKLAFMLRLGTEDKK